MILSTFLLGCAKEQLVNNPLQGIPDDVFQSESTYEGPLNTIKDLSKGYIYNASAVEAANNKLKTICIAAERCVE